MKIITPFDKAFMQGAVCAIAYIVKGHGASTMTEEALRAIGLHNRQTAIKYGVDKYDLNVLWPKHKRFSQ